MTAPDSPRPKRLFFALPIPSPVKSTLSHFQNPLQSLDLPMKWQEKKLMHLTLVFLGEHPESHVEALSGLLETVGKQTPRFSLTLDAPGAFPSVGFPRILWMGIEPSAALTDLRARLVQVLDQAGLRADHRDFHPHITLGRCPHTLTATENGLIRELLSAPPRLSGPTAWEVDRIHLYESHTDEFGLHYTPIASVLLPERL